MSNEANLEKLNQALDSLLRAGDFMTCADPRGFIRLSNRLFDAAIECGMRFDEADHIAWSAERVALWLCSAPLAEAA